MSKITHVNEVLTPASYVADLSSLSPLGEFNYLFLTDYAPHSPDLVAFSAPHAWVSLDPPTIQNRRVNMCVAAGRDYAYVPPTARDFQRQRQRENGCTCVGGSISAPPESCLVLLSTCQAGDARFSLALIRTAHRFINFLVASLYVLNEI